MKIFLYVLLMSQLYFAQGYKVVTEVIKGAKDKTETAQVNYAVYSGKDKVYSVQKEFAYDIPYSKGITDGNGFLYLINAFDTRVEIYNPEAVNVASIKIYPEDVEYERTIHPASFWSSIIIGISEPKQMRAKLFELDNKGNIKNEFTLNEKYLTLIAADENSDLLAVSAYGINKKGIEGKTYFYSQHFTPVAELNMCFTKGGFYDEGKLFAANNNKEYALYNLRSKKFSENGEVNNGTLYATYYANGNLYYIKYLNSELKNGNWFLVKPQLFKVKNGETELIQTKLPSSVEKIDFASSNGRVEIITDGKRITVTR